jgi:hypothetical protein
VWSLRNGEDAQTLIGQCRQEGGKKTSSKVREPNSPCDRVADDTPAGVTHAVLDETGKTTSDNPCRARFRPGTIASDLICLEHLRLALADVLAA